MNMIVRWRAAAAAALATAAALALSAWIVSPGTFEASLELRRDGQFTFTYNGEIYLLALTQLAAMANAETTGEFAQQPCYDDENYEERDCTEDEIAEQRRTWDEQAASRKAQQQRDAEQMKAMLGGIDPSDPEAAEELAERLRRQEGWKRVEYRGKGMLDVEFAITSRLGHDFSFPTLERFPIYNSFLQANLRQGNIVRVEAPGFSPQGAGNPFQTKMAAMAGNVNTRLQSEESGMPPVPEVKGTFRILTDGKILANNTDEGPQAGPGGQTLVWEVNSRTQAAPMALIQLGD
jgi:hypothetical protein